MPHRLTLAGMCAEIRAGRLSGAELLEAHLRQIEEQNSLLNAFTLEIPAERNPPPGPLHGIPVTVKDSFDIVGHPTLCGSSSRLDHRAARDSTPVARLRRAGAVILGKTNCPEFLMNYETDNHVTGRTNNPWDLERTPGGSSGGESAAIAAFCSAGGIGSDGGGSIRFPAHCTGIAGLKPTPGRCPATGHFPGIVHPGGLLGVGGPMARTVEDVRLLFEVLAGHDAEDPFSAPVPLRAPELGGLRIGVMKQFPGIPAQAGIGEAVERAARLLEELGLVVEEFIPRGIERAPLLWRFLFQELPLQAVDAWLTDETHWSGRELLDAVRDEPAPSAETVLKKLAARDKARAALMREMREFGVLLWPAANVLAFRHRQREFQTAARAINYFEAMAPLTTANLYGLPALAVPVMVSSDGLPVGAQLIGRPWEEELLLELGMRLEAARGALPSAPV
ncbi:MAG: amidase [bacterium]|nr:amidase [bacterium]